MKSSFPLLLFVCLVGVHPAAVWAEDNQPTSAEVSSDAVYASLEGLAEGSEEAQGRQRKAVAKHPLEIKLTKSSLSPLSRVIDSSE